MKTTRCAIYTRKSHEEGLEQSFNSLDAQRVAASSFIQSQQHEGWEILPTAYDDGGFSGGTMERPALQQLFTDIKAGKIDCVVVYKIDRLSRSLVDFTRILEFFEQHQVSFVAVTQSFNTSNSMGKLMLNILICFAQYERELTGERIRDKFALSRQRGAWMGGNPPLGYDIENRKLVVNEEESKLVQHIFKRFVHLRSGTQLVRELNAAGYTTKQRLTAAGKMQGGYPFTRNTLHKLLNNPLYKGLVTHKQNHYPGEHTPLIDPELWEQVQAVFQTSPILRAKDSARRTPALLKGLLYCAHCEAAMIPTFTKKKDKLYRYYFCNKHAQQASSECPLRSVPAGEVEQLATTQALKILQTPEVMARTLQTVKSESKDAISEEDSLPLLRQIPILWQSLFPLEQARILQLLIERIELQEEGMNITFHPLGIKTLAQQLHVKESIS